MNAFLSAVLVVTCSVLPTTSSSAQKEPTNEPQQTPVAMMKPSALEGTPVQTLNGQYLGEVDAVVIRRAGNHIGFVVPVGGLMGIGATDVFIPADEVHLKVEMLVWQTKQPAEQIVYFASYQEQQYSRVTDQYGSLNQVRQSFASVEQQ